MNQCRMAGRKVDQPSRHACWDDHCIDRTQSVPPILDVNRYSAGKRDCYFGTSSRVKRIRGLRRQSQEACEQVPSTIVFTHKRSQLNSRDDDRDLGILHELDRLATVGSPS